MSDELKGSCLGKACTVQHRNRDCRGGKNTRRMDDLDAENVMCRRVNVALREQIQGLFKEVEGLKEERDLVEESKNHANKLCGERTNEWRAQLIKKLKEANIRLTGQLSGITRDFDTLSDAHSKRLDLLLKAIGEQEIAIKSGPHLGAVRKWIKWNCPNGDRVIWGSDTVLGKFTVRQLEELAQRIADEAELDRGIE